MGCYRFGWKLRRSASATLSVVEVVELSLIVMARKQSAPPTVVR